MKPSRLLLAFASALLLVGGIIWHAFPKTTGSILLDLNASSAGLSVKSLDTDFGPIGYLEGGEGETVVLIHGIFARKEHWIDVARTLVERHHVIALDLPGFGDNPPLPDGSYGVREQARRLGQVLDALELEAVHIGANSMGAYIAALHAAEDPAAIASLAFIGSPLGVPSPIQSDMEKALDAGDIPLLAQSREEFEARNAWLSPNPLEVPSPVLITWRDAELAMADKNARIWREVHALQDVPNLVELAPALAMPTLVLWCEEDRIFHVSGAGELRGRLPDARVKILEGCGHVPMIDKPEEVAALYRDFLVQLAD